MRIVFIGASPLAVTSARQLLEKGHEVVIIEADKARIDELSDGLDCSFIQGDGSRPATLKKVGPENTDYLFCLGGNDQQNIIAALVGQALHFGRVITKIEDEDFEQICTQLGLENTILPDREVGRRLVEMIEKKESAGLAALVKGGVRFFSFVATEKQAGPIENLSLPEKAQVIAVTRGDRSTLSKEVTEIQEGDEILVITHEDQIDELRKRFHQDQSVSQELK
jgi:trk system potassium uptake protein TrkA